jgi:hypothetical protein
VKNDDIDGSHHAVSHVWQAKGSERLGEGAGRMSQREVIDNKPLFYESARAVEIQVAPTYKGST